MHTNLFSLDQIYDLIYLKLYVEISLRLEAVWQTFPYGIRINKPLLPLVTADTVSTALVVNDISLPDLSKNITITIMLHPSDRLNILQNIVECQI